MTSSRFTHQQKQKVIDETVLSFSVFVKRVIIDQRDGWVSGAHIERMCDTIQGFLESSDKSGLMITMPPRHMKSVTISNALAPWWLLRHPQAEFIMASYALSLARDNLRACRQVFDSSAFKAISRPGHRHFDVDSADSLQLHCKQNGRPNIIAAGAGGPITGKGADVFIIDDPVKDAVQADSPTYRKRLYDWYKMVVESRLSPNGKKILVMTRWRHDDLAGQILEAEADDWEVLNLPAISDNGEALWPQRFDLARLERIRSVLGSRSFEAQYQGRPTPADGGLVKRSWFAYGPPAPRSGERVRAWDLAGTQGGGDWTSGVLMCCVDGRFTVEDIVHIQGSPAQVQELVRATAERDGRDVHIVIEQEGGSSGKTVIDLYANRLLVGFPVHAVKPSGPKESRASALIASMERGDVTWVRGQNAEVVEDEFSQFPLGAHDDLVDATAHAYNFLAERRSSAGKMWWF